MARRGWGEGSVYKRGNRYAYLLPRQLAEERGVDRYKGGFRTRRDAQDALREAITSAEQGTLVKRDVRTLDAYVDEVFLPKVKAQRRSSTHAMYAEKLRVHVLPHIGDRRLQSITSLTLDQLWTRLQNGDHGRPALSARSVRMVYSIVRQLLEDAKGHGLIPRNPADASSPPSRRDAAPPEREVWSAEQIQTFLDHVAKAEPIQSTAGEVQQRRCRTCERSLPATMFAREPRGRDGLKPDCRECVGTKRRATGARPGTHLQLRIDRDSLYPLFVLAARTGMRRGELCGLKWSDVDLDAGLVHLRRQHAKDGEGNWRFADLKTDRSRRTVPLTKDAVDALQQHRAQQLRRRMALGPAYDSELDMVFALADGAPLVPAYVTRRFRALAIEAGLPPIKLHGLRHSYATIASEHDLAAAADVLGHHDRAFTVTQYVHPDLERMRRLQDGIA